MEVWAVTSVWCAREAHEREFVYVCARGCMSVCVRMRARAWGLHRGLLHGRDVVWHASEFRVGAGIRARERVGQVDLYPPNMPAMLFFEFFMLKDMA